MFTSKPENKTLQIASENKQRSDIFFQPKLTINQPNNAYEQETDAVAEKVIRMSGNENARQPFFKPAISSVQRKCAECEKEEKQPVQRKETSNAPPVAENRLESYVLGLAGGGQPLSKQARDFFEPRMGYDFNNVKLHTDSNAANSAQSMNALAYTTGNNIVFNKGQFMPETDNGKRLMAHELTHVVQQNSHTVQPWFIQRRLMVNPSGQTSYVAGLLSFICSGGGVTHSGNEITSHCSTSTDTSCECVCDVTSDSARTYTINVQPQSNSPQNMTLWDGTNAIVPLITPWPNTAGGINPTVTIHSSSGRNTEMGSFDSSGRVFYYDDWRILAHELCGHARLNQTYSGGTGNRPGHDSTIDTENTIAFEHGPYVMRGHFSDPRQGESFFNPIGNRSKIGFFQTNGIHYEAP